MTLQARIRNRGPVPSLFFQLRVGEANRSCPEPCIFGVCLGQQQLYFKAFSGEINVLYTSIPYADVFCCTPSSSSASPASLARRPAQTIGPQHIPGIPVLMPPCTNLHTVNTVQIAPGSRKHARQVGEDAEDVTSSASSPTSPASPAFLHHHALDESFKQATCC